MRLLPLRFVVVALSAALLLGAGGAAYVLFGPGLHLAAGAAFERPPARAEAEPSHQLVRDSHGKPVEPPTLRLSEQAARALNLQPDSLATVQSASAPRPLPPIEGTLAYETDYLFAVRPRFAGEVVEIAPPEGETGQPRPLGFGDRVVKGQLLAVIWSRDLGDKKAALIDSLIDLRRDQKRLRDLEKLYEEGAYPAAQIYEAQRTVQKELNAVNAAERTLRMWKLEEREIEELTREAAAIEQTRRDPRKEKGWARVEVRAPHDGVIVEKNTNIGDWADPSRDTPLFRIADLGTLAVWAHPLEEYLPVFRSFMGPGSRTKLRWQIRLQADPKAPVLEGPILRVAPSVDPNQHTLLVIGRVANPEGRLLVGQTITATVAVAPERGLVEIPTAALNEQNGQSVVFVQAQPGKLEFTMRRVAVAARFKDTVLVRSELSEADRQEAEHAADLPLRPGERVAAHGVPMLTVALRDALAREDSNSQAK